MKLITANRLSDGRVVYVGPDGGPTAELDRAAMFEDDEAAAALAAAAARPDVFVGPYAVEAEDRRPSGRDRLKETIRAFGPTVGHSLGAN